MLSPAELYFAGASPLAPVHRAVPLASSHTVKLLAGRRTAQYRLYEPAFLPVRQKDRERDRQPPLATSLSQSKVPQTPLGWRARGSPIVFTDVGGRVLPRRDAHGFELQPIHTRFARHIAIGANVSFFRPHPNSPCVKRHMGAEPWAVAHVQRGAHEFDLAVYNFPSHDLARDTDLASNQWDEAGFGTIMEYTNSFKAKILLDVGAGVGWYSFAYATEGRTVLAIEPFGPNLDLFNTSFCLNPAQNATIGLMPIGLSSASRRCDLYQRKDGKDFGNAVTVCKGMNTSAADKSLSKQGEVETYMLDDVLPDEFRTGAKVMRVDIGAHQFPALKGCTSLLVQEGERPLAVSTEFSNGPQASEFLKFMHGMGYSVSAANGEPPHKQPPNVSTILPDPNATIDLIFDRPALRQYLNLEKYQVLKPADSATNATNAAKTIRRAMEGLPPVTEKRLRKCESAWDGDCDRSAFTGKEGMRPERQKELQDIKDKENYRESEYTGQQQQDAEDDEHPTYDAMKEIHDAMQAMGNIAQP